MILVTFSSAENALSNDVKKYNIFCSQGTENPLFRFFLGHPGIIDGHFIKEMCLIVTITPINIVWFKSFSSFELYE